MEIFDIDTKLLERPEAANARSVGLLTAKQEAMKSARRLVKLGRPLQFLVAGVSFLHIWYQISLVRPAGVAALELWPSVHHVANGILTGAVDLVLIYLITTRSAAAFAGGKAAHRAVWFFYVLTAILNGVFMLQFSPSTPKMALEVIPALDLFKTILLALLIPVSLVSIENAHQAAATARLKLLVEIATLEGALKHVGGTESNETAPADTIHSDGPSTAQNGAYSVLAQVNEPHEFAPAQTFTLDDARRVMGEELPWLTDMEQLNAARAKRGLEVDVEAFLRPERGTVTEKPLDVIPAPDTDNELASAAALINGAFRNIVQPAAGYDGNAIYDYVEAYKRKHGKPDWQEIGNHFNLSADAARAKYRRAASKQ